LDLHPVIGASRGDDSHEVMGGWTGASPVH